MRGTQETNNCLEPFKETTASNSRLGPFFCRVPLTPGGGLIVAPDPFTVVNRGVINGLAARYRLPAIFTLRQDVVEGALMSYGPDTADIIQRSAMDIDRILEGAKHEEFPVRAPTKYLLGITISPTLLAQADEVAE